MAALMARGWRIGAAVAAVLALFTLVYVYAIEPAMAPKPLVQLSPRVEGLLAQYKQFYRRVERLSKKGTPQQQEWARRALLGAEPQPETDELWNETVAVLDDPTVGVEEKVVLLSRGSLAGRLYPEDKLKANIISEEALASMRPQVLLALADNLWIAPVRLEGRESLSKGVGREPRSPILIRYVGYSRDLARLAAGKDPSEGMYALASLHFEHQVRSSKYGSDYDAWPKEAYASYLRTALEDIRAFNRAEKYRWFYPAPYLWPMTDEVEPRLAKVTRLSELWPLGRSISMFANFAVARVTPFLCEEEDISGLVELQTFSEKKLLVRPTWYKFTAKADSPLYLYREIGKSLAPGDKKSLANDLYERIKELKEAEFEARGGMDAPLSGVRAKKATEPFLIELREVLAEGRKLIESLTPEDFAWEEQG